MNNECILNFSFSLDRHTIYYNSCSLLLLTVVLICLCSVLCQMENLQVKKRLQKLLKVALFMLRRGLLRHRILQELGMAVKKGKVIGKNLAHSLTFMHLPSRPNATFHNDYEFSCTSSPVNPSSLNSLAKRRSNKLLQCYFPTLALPCIHPQPKGEESFGIHEWSARFTAFLQVGFSENNANEDVRKESCCSTVGEEWATPYCSSVCTPSSRWSTAEEEDEETDDNVEMGQVDRLAEEFIARFYDDIKLQRQSSLVHYQEMLARGAN